MNSEIKKLREDVDELKRLFNTAHISVTGELRPIPAEIVTQDTSHRFATDIEKSAWTGNNTVVGNIDGGVADTNFGGTDPIDGGTA